MTAPSSCCLFSLYPQDWIQDVASLKTVEWLRGNACVCLSGVGVRAGLASHPQRGIATWWWLHPGVVALFLKRKPILLRLELRLEPYAKHRDWKLWREFHLPRERWYGHLQVGRTMAALASGSQTLRRVPFTLGPQEGIQSHQVLESYNFTANAFFLLHHPCWSPDNIPAPHLCSPLFLAPLKLAHHCRTIVLKC